MAVLSRLARLHAADAVDTPVVLRFPPRPRFRPRAGVADATLIALSLHGKVAPEVFLSGVESFLATLKSVTQSVLGTSSAIKWIVASSSGRGMIVLQGRPRGRLGDDAVKRTLSRFASGLEALNTSADLQPQHFTRTALHHARNLTGLAHSHSSIEHVDIHMNGRTRTISRKALADRVK